MRDRTRRFAIELIRFSSTLPQTDEGRIIRGQIVRAGTAVGANYRSVCRARSAKDFIAKLGIVIEEADETAYWLEIAVDAGLAASTAAQSLRTEVDELTRIFVVSRRTARKNALKGIKPER